MSTMNNQEQTIIAPLGQALQDARLLASLSVEEVAEQLNLAMCTVRDIEDDLDNTIESQKYPAIYLRGYLTNYAKLVGLDKLNQFIEYQDLSPCQKAQVNLRSPMIIPPPVKKRSKLLWLLLITIIAVCIYLLALQQGFFTENTPVNPDIEETKFSSEGSFAEVNIITAAQEKDEISVESEAADIVPATDIVAKNKIQTEAEIVKETIAAAVVEEQPEADLLTMQETTEKDALITNKQVITDDASLDKTSPEQMLEQTAVTMESLQLTFSADCWTEIFDARGKRLAFDLYKKGSLLTVNGVAPFQLKLGDPSVVEIQYQDKILEREFAVGRTTRFSIPQ